MIARRPFLLLSFLIVTAASGVPQEATSVPSSVAGAVITLVVGTPDGGSDTVRRIVSSSIELALIRRGVLVVAGETTVVSEVRSESGLAEARSAGSDFLLQAAVTPIDDEIEIVLSLYETGDGDLLARIQATEPVALTLDRALSTLTDRLLAQGASAVETAADERRAEAAARENERAAEAAREADEREAADRRASGDDARRTEGRDAGTTPTTAPVGPPLPNRLMSVSAGFVPIVPVDRTASYLTIGYGGTLVLAVMPFDDDLFGFGLTVRTAFATVTGAATSVDLLLLPLGLTARLAAPAQPLGAFLRVTAGAAFIRATSALLGSFPDVIPYASADAGVRVSIGLPVAIELGVGVESYFEGSIVILGVTPGIALVVEL